MFFVQVPANSEEKAVAFVHGLVPSAVVTQRHMGALSFNIQNLQVRIEFVREVTVL